MFGFKAYFWDDQVYINDRAYRSNEILTACLNISQPEDILAQRLHDLERLLPRVQIFEDSYDVAQDYNRQTQRAQQLFFYIGGILQQVLPYTDPPFSAVLQQPLLFDRLNAAYHNWATGDWEYDVGFSNEYGFVTKDDAGNYHFYVQLFYPKLTDVAASEDDETIFAPLNEAVEELFGEYAGLLKDLLRAKAAYAEFLDGYIHGKSKFLSDGETAEQFISYMKSAAHKPDYKKVTASGFMKLSHEVYRRPDGREKLCETYTFDSLGTFLYFDFFRGLGRSHVPKRCGHCGRYFLLDGGKYSSYCERPLEDDPEKTCRDVGARRRYDDKCRSDPVWLAYNRAYKTHYARYMKKKMTVAEFEEWSRQAVEWRTQAEAGELERTEYERLLKK